LICSAAVSLFGKLLASSRQTRELAFNLLRFAKTWASPLTSKGHGEGRAERI